MSERRMNRRDVLRAAIGLGAAAVMPKLTGWAGQVPIDADPYWTQAEIEGAAEIAKQTGAICDTLNDDLGRIFYVNPTIMNPEWPVSSTIAEALARCSSCDMVFVWSI